MGRDARNLVYFRCGLNAKTGTLQNVVRIRSVIILFVSRGEFITFRIYYKTFNDIIDISDIWDDTKIVVIGARVKGQQERKIKV